MSKDILSVCILPSNVGNVENNLQNTNQIQLEVFVVWNVVRRINRIGQKNIVKSPKGKKHQESHKEES